MILARKKKNETTGLEQGAGFQTARLRPADVQQIEFRVSRKGYNETEVDEFLDRVTEELVALAEENKTLREGGVVPGMGAAEATAEAQAIVRNARAEADAILAAARAGSGEGGDDPLATVYPFLTKEREFLGALGEMVRAHMETIKSDARALQEAARSAPPAAPPAAPSAAPEAPAPQAPAAPAPEAPAAQAPETAAPSEPSAGSLWEATAAPAPAPATPAAPVVPPAAPEPAAAPEPEVAAIPHSDVDTPTDPEEEPSLKDLFWGDE